MIEKSHLLVLCRALEWYDFYSNIVCAQLKQVWKDLKAWKTIQVQTGFKPIVDCAEPAENQTN